MAKSVGNIALLRRRARALGPRRASSCSSRRATTASRCAFSDETLGAGAGQRAADPRGGAPARARGAVAGGPRAARRALLRRARRRLQHAEGARGALRVDPRGQQARGRRRRRPARDARRCSGSRRCSSGAGGDADARTTRRARCSRRARRRAPRKDWAEADRLRDELAALGWQVRDAAGGPTLVRAVILYGRNAGARGAARRAAARLRDLGDASGVDGEAWLRDAGVPRARRDRPPRSRSAPTARRHQGVCAERRGLPVRRRGTSCSTQPDPLIVALDEVQDPQNLGAICRTAEGVGRDRAS